MMPQLGCYESNTLQAAELPMRFNTNQIRSRYDPNVNEYSVKGEYELQNCPKHVQALFLDSIGNHAKQFCTKKQNRTRFLLCCIVG